MDDFFEHILEILKKKDLNKEDVNILKELLNNQENFKKFEKSLSRIWDSSNRYSKDFDYNKILYNIHNTIKEEKVTDYNYSFHRSRITSILKYAAVFLIGFFSWFLINIFIDDKNVDRNYYKKDYNLSYNEIIVPYGSKSKVKLPDGTFVTLNSGSKLIYPVFFRGEKREVYLEGEAHFQVKSDSAHPFYVKTDEITIKVLGTVFNVKAYPETNTIETTLIEGSLEIINNSRLKIIQRERKVLLKPSQKAIYIKNEKKLTFDEKVEVKLKAYKTEIPEIKIQEKANIDLIVAWKDNRLIFDNERFEDIAIKLQRWFNVVIEIKSEELKGERFTGKFENETIEQILNALKLAEPFEYKMNKNQIIIYKNL